MKKNQILLLLIISVSLLMSAGCGTQEVVGAADSSPEDAGVNSGSFSSEVNKPEAEPNMDAQAAEGAVIEEGAAPAIPLANDPVQSSAQVENSNPVPEQYSPDTQEEALQGELPPAEPRIGYLAPEISLPKLGGGTVNLSDLRGKNVLINYWVTWCVPCMEELPALERFYNDYQQQDLVILSINGIEENDLSEVEMTVSEFGLTYPVLLDEKDSFHDSYWVQFLPTTFFVDKQGIIRDILKGSTTEQGFRTRIEQLISGTS